MRIPLSWLKEYVDIHLPVEQLAHRLTLAGLEVEAIEYIGVPAGEASHDLAVPVSTDHLVWDRQKIVVGHILEVKAHPNADRLVLAMVESGIGQVETVVTGAPNLYPYKDEGPIKPPLVCPYAREGAEVIDGHKDDGSRMILAPRNLRGIENKTMVCSAKELGLSDDHEGILLLETDARPGTPLQDVLGDVILTIGITPNMARCMSMLGVAREVSALTGKKVRNPSQEVKATGAPIAGQVKLDIREPDLNPRFTLALIKGVQIKPSPEWMQRRLRQLGMRPINNIVDVTNYVMLETGQPLHAFDYDVLAERVGGKPPTIITRLPGKGETLTTLDGVERQLDPFTILVCDEKGALSLGGIMGGAESEIYDASTYVLDAQGIAPDDDGTTERVPRADVVTPPLHSVERGSGGEAGPGGEVLPRGKADSRPPSTTNVLLEAANWNLINMRQTLQAQRERGKEIASEAGARFSRGVHPAQASLGLLRAIELMRQVAGGEIAEGILDQYPRPAPSLTIRLPLPEVERLLGVSISEDEIARILTGLDFSLSREKGKGLLHVTVPDNRLDIGLPPGSPHADIAEAVARADLIEDIGRIYGLDRIPETMIDDVVPPQHDNPSLAVEERARDLAARAGLTEVVTYRLTTPDAEAALIPPGGKSDWPGGEYTRLANPISADKVVMRHTVLAGVLAVMAANARWQTRQAVFEIGKVYLPAKGKPLPDEPTRLCVALTGQRDLAAWQEGRVASALMDFYDLKGIVMSILAGLRLPDARFEPTAHSTFYPGRVASLIIGDKPIGVLGELHPLVREAFGLPDQPVLAAEIDLDPLVGIVNPMHTVQPFSSYPAVYQDIALIVAESVPGAQVEGIIRETGGDLLVGARLFDVYRGDQIGAAQKSLAYALTFQAADRTLTDDEADAAREKIMKALEKGVGAKLRM